VRIPRFFVSFESFDFEKGQVTLADPAIVSQISNVLRLKIGSYIHLLDGRGKIHTCTISEVTRAKKKDGSQLIARIDSSREASGESKVHTVLALPILRLSRFEWALEKLTELGVARIVPIVTQLAVAREAKLDRWRSIVREAAEQCERGLIPEVVAPVSLEEYLGTINVDPNVTNFICVERADHKGVLPLHTVLCNFGQMAPHKISVIVGAEGGFTSGEVLLAEEAHLKPVSLGKRILRTETAAVYTMAIIDAVLESAQD
jgi:16S rRNA (uracil1498-N3)-methyltransferase